MTWRKRRTKTWKRKLKELEIMAALLLLLLLLLVVVVLLLLVMVRLFGLRVPPSCQRDLVMFQVPLDLEITLRFFVFY